ncbi:MAG TPA: hypothetical protein VLL08_03890 [Kineosporiaceae bacterium]|nr:hypothetical protein [Kineosporiaceae bacterium]
MNKSSQRRPSPEQSAPEPNGEAAPTRRPDGRTRLVVELNRATAADLDDLVALEDLNKTTLVNRALQMYAILRKAERDGGQILIQEAGESAPQRIRFL